MSLDDDAGPTRFALLEGFFRRRDEAGKLCAVRRRANHPCQRDAREITPGTGASPKGTDTVTVNYEGRLTDGTVFDSSRQRGGPATVPLNGVIKCWTEALQLIKVRGKSRLVCPADLAYGDQGWPPLIKPGATLVFEVELLGISQGSAQTATQSEPASSWYYCNDAKAYFPYVRECPSGWLQVLQTAPPGQ